MAETADAFKWFGEGFDGFPVVLPEDCVEYYIYIIDADLKDLESREQLQAVEKAAQRLISSSFKDYLWQRESFGLQLEVFNSRCVLRGRTNYGDSTDDEWSIVYILHQLSREFPEVWIRVFDSDGEFLLIEAANVLPIWLNPEVGDHRAWIHNGQLLLIPLDSPGGRRKTSDLQDQLTIDDAIAYIADPTKSVQRSLKVEKEAFARLEKYPEHISASLHHAVITVPRLIAAIIHETPSCISPVVEAFYLRDPIVLKSVRGRVIDDLYFPPQDFVQTSVAFTKIGFAQLKGQHFDAPFLWKHPLSTTENVIQRTMMEVGIKITCGFEMLLSDKSKTNSAAAGQIKALADAYKADQILPSDNQIKSWGMRQDDESWLDINFEEFEKELSGEQQPQKSEGQGFGDRSAHAKLQRTVKRYRDMLAQEAEAGSLDLLDDLDYDDDSASEASSDDTDEADESGRDLAEKDFAAMMQEMMGMPPDVMEEVMQGNIGHKGVTGLDSDEGIPRSGKKQRREAKTEVINESMDQIKRELQDAGALDP